MELQTLCDSFSVCKVASFAGVDLMEPYCFTAATGEELSLVCPTEHAPTNALNREDGWRAFRIAGELDFSLVGILARILQILASEQIAVFALSTFNTDYVLVKEEVFEQALCALRAHGYCVR